MRPGGRCPSSRSPARSTWRARSSSTTSTTSSAARSPRDGVPVVVHATRSRRSRGARPARGRLRARRGRGAPRPRPRRPHLWLATPSSRPTRSAPAISAPASGASPPSRSSSRWARSCRGPHRRWARSPPRRTPTRATGPPGSGCCGAAARPAEVVERLTAADDGRDQRQLGVVDAAGRGATFTGDACHAWAGGRVGDGYAAQGNILVSGGDGRRARRDVRRLRRPPPRRPPARLPRSRPGGRRRPPRPAIGSAARRRTGRRLRRALGHARRPPDRRPRSGRSRSCGASTAFTTPCSGRRRARTGSPSTTHCAPRSTSDSRPSATRPSTTGPESRTWRNGSTAAPRSIRSSLRRCETQADRALWGSHGAVTGFSLSPGSAPVRSGDGQGDVAANPGDRHSRSPGEPQESPGSRRPAASARKPGTGSNARAAQRAARRRGRHRPGRRRAARGRQRERTPCAPEQPPNGTSSSGAARPASTSPWVTAPIETSTTIGGPSLDGIAIASGFVPVSGGPPSGWASRRGDVAVSTATRPALRRASAPSTRARRSGSSADATTTRAARRRPGDDVVADRLERQVARARRGRPSGRARGRDRVFTGRPGGRTAAARATGSGSSRGPSCPAARHPRNARTGLRASASPSPSALQPRRRLAAVRGTSLIRVSGLPLSRRQSHRILTNTAHHANTRNRGSSAKPIPKGGTSNASTLIIALGAAAALATAAVAVAALTVAGVSATTATFTAEHGCGRPRRRARAPTAPYRDHERPLQRRDDRPSPIRRATSTGRSRSTPARPQHDRRARLRRGLVPGQGRATAALSGRFSGTLKGGNARRLPRRASPAGTTPAVLGNLSATFVRGHRLHRRQALGTGSSDVVARRRSPARLQGLEA